MSEQESKKQILKSTGILGSAQIIIILIGIVRVKVLAVLLGPVGVGLAGLYQTTIDFISSATGFGLRSSAVRDIAASEASADETKIASTVLVLRKWTWGTGLLGMLVTIIFCRQLSMLAFGSDAHALNIALLSVSLLLFSISGGLSALLQGKRRVGDMAKADVMGAAFGLIGTVSIYYFWGLNGIVPALLLTYILMLAVSWYFARKIKVPRVKLALPEIFQRGKSMASLGFFLSLTGLMATGTMYVVRSFVMKQGGLASVGHFVAAWSISSMYISAIFGAMSADYYPRLSAVQQNPASVTKLVNEQTEIALLITAPIIIGMISFIDLVVLIIYSREFGPTAGILDWQLMGDLFKVLSWPLGYILLAKGKGKTYIVTELCWNLLFCTGVYLGWKYFGIEITGVAFLVSYIMYVLLLLWRAKKLVAFKWSANTGRYMLVFLPLLVACFLTVRFFKEWWQHYLVCATLTMIAISYSVMHLRHIIDLNAVLKKLKLRR